MVEIGKKYEIISLSNEKVKVINSLSKRKYRNELQLFIAEGIRVCKEALSNGWSFKYFLFDKSNAVQISPSALKNFGNIISPLSVQLKTNQAFYNKLGPNVENSGDDQIYIECNPVGSSDDDTFVKMPGFSGDGSGYNLPKWLTKKNLKKLVKNPWFIGVMVFIAALILYGVFLGYVKYFKPNVPELKKKLGFGNKPPDAAPPTT